MGVDDRHEERVRITCIQLEFLDEIERRTNCLPFLAYFRPMLTPLASVLEASPSSMNPFSSKLTHPARAGVVANGLIAHLMGAIVGDNRRIFAVVPSFFLRTWKECSRIEYMMRPIPVKIPFM